MGRRGWFSALLVVTVAVVLGFAGLKAFRGSSAEECYACSRLIHAHSRTVALANGHARLFCCPACALSEHEQEGKPIKVTQLTSFLTGATLSPDSAYVVKGSDVNMCATTHEITTPTSDSQVYTTTAAHPVFSHLPSKARLWSLCVNMVARCCLSKK